MLDLATDTALKDLLNQFSVPMFALDRTPPSSEFRFVCVNRSLELLSTLSEPDILGKTVHEMLPDSEADVTCSHLSKCVETRNNIRFRDRFVPVDQPPMWDTTVQYVALPNGGDRLIGVCIQLAEDDHDTGSEPSLDDIQYLSSLADLQLRNLISTFEIFREKDLFSIQNEQHIDKLTAMCRTVQCAVGDIKKIVGARTEDSTSSKLKKSLQAKLKMQSGSNTIEALMSDVRADLHRAS